MPFEADTLYALTPQEFERLCVDLLRVQRMENIELVGGPDDQGVDIVGTDNGEPVVAQVRHSRHLALATVRDDIARIVASTYKPRRILFITSAQLTAESKSRIQQLGGDTPVTVMDQQDVLRVLNEHPNARHPELYTAERRTIRQRWALSLGLGALTSSLAGLIQSVASFYLTGPSEQPLREQIGSVERAIGHLKDLEHQLTEIKDDMVETEQAKKALEEEYAKAKELEKLSEVQFDAVRAALRSQSWQKTAFDYVIGFLLGVGASLTASVIYARLQQRRALSK